LALLEAVAGMDEGALQPALAGLRAAGFLHELTLVPQVEYSFKHALIMEVAYGSLLRDRRRALHGRVVEELERLYADRLGGWVERLAYHALRAERWDRAAAYHRLAGQKAALRSANREAVVHFEQALAAVAHLPESPAALEQGVDLRLDLRPPLLQLGRLDDALARSTEAERLAQRLGDAPRLARVYTYLINHHYLKGEPAAAIAYAERCLALSDLATDLTLQAMARQYIGQSRHVQAEYDEARRVLEANVEALAPAVALPAAQLPYVACCGWLAFALAETGAFAEAHAAAERGVQAMESSPHAYGQAIAWTLAALVSVWRGHLTRALLPLERSLELCRRRQLTLWQPIAASLLGLAFARLGQAPEGVRLLEEGVRLSEAVGVRAYLPLWKVTLGEGLLAAGRVDEAQATALEALELARRQGEPGHEAAARRLLGAVAARPAPPDVTGAEAQYARAIEAARRLGMRPLLARCHLGLGSLYARAGDATRSAEQDARGRKLLADLGMRSWPGDAGEPWTPLAQLFVVAGWSPDLYEFLRRELAGAGGVQVIVDRRRAASPTPAPPHPDDRRRAHVDAELRGWGLAVVPAQPETARAVR
ncbi:MAG TPA: hypothetical protein VFX28_10280, partial [Methylomirabilota bacterium]|nr:hypothetical protein [Methylomirabilota bacterium]